MSKPQNLPRVYSARERQDAARVLRAARHLLEEGKHPFPVLEAARKERVRTDSRAWELVEQAREAVGGKRDGHQLEAAVALLQKGAPSQAPSSKLSRVPRCRLRAQGSRCGRPITHGGACAPEPPPDDLVRAVGTDHVLIGGPPTDTKTIVAWETGNTAKILRVRRDDHGRGLWIDHPSGPRRTSAEPLLLGWPEIRRLVLDLNLEIADHRDATVGQPSAGSRIPKGSAKNKP